MSALQSLPGALLYNFQKPLSYKHVKFQPPQTVYRVTWAVKWAIELSYCSDIKQFKNYQVLILISLIS